MTIAVQTRDLSPLARARQARGTRAMLSGAAAEARVERAYRDRGCDVLATRWRGSGGEVDLIVRRGDLLVFVEVKSSASYTRAIESLSLAQLTRIQNTALEFLDRSPDLAGLEMRFDLAVVEGSGRFRVLANITM
ncbi:conserved hypothetical protein [Dinoroseobacter shibae DFL 12 = DSM 16493]|jgi:putative endonuclease|uniref:UPF0102 protein Dshi_2830 n=1 Tax=Dinoroseobacter shibae (strain DSM 16493 / NCIMB 14021 / DFL 12) TaxID=398580 RepID=Y2830_DINSH|nr:MULTISPECIES: YraN family protein [Dinoroseobacter]A8LJ68.1 RecName: Full=UPF0102 protein Dshi_2830 [Dinoroseobacter shibae DFL 12 = DSM 16493]ABV94563.1 conserved hypothetical protein [Dinoroseobacter shibae DFL 12 = DSM 16493]MDD9716995.1 YraN family protein [Dinoroseobacter sp. PD6]URF45990.1 YraN family protein [Dinoroseobacter shibae]URF50296.1 YraN family protein [Dinoroseobacter shibae]